MKPDFPEHPQIFDSTDSGSSDQPLQMVIVCRSEETAAHWQKRELALKGIQIVTKLGCHSYYRVIADIMAENHTQPVLLCHDDIWCGLGFAESVHELISELSQGLACWGICGNAGISWDGKQIHRYIKDPHGGPQQGLFPEPVLGIDGNMILLNVPALAAAGLEVPDLGGFHGYDIVLSLETLRCGLPVLCDRRLFVMHKSGGDGSEFQKFVDTDIFRNYLVKRFLNHTLPTINGSLDTSSTHDYGYLDIPFAKTGQQDVVDLFDRALAAGRRNLRPSVTICCRTQFNRPELLTRAVTSFAVAAQQAPDLLSLKVCIISDKPEEQMTPELTRLRPLFPGLDLEGWTVTCRPDRFSRTDVLLHAIEKAETDFIWFVDDDDFVIPGAIRPLARSLASSIPRLLVGNSVRIEELWEADSSGVRQVKSSVLVGKNEADGIFYAFDGDNHTPICSVVFPLDVLKQRINGVAALGDYYEDYFLILLALTAPRIEVRVVHEDFCGISLRSGENTVTEPVRDHWDLSYATFITEVLRHPEATSPLLWQLCDRNRISRAELHLSDSRASAADSRATEADSRATEANSRILERDARIACLDDQIAALEQHIIDRDNTISAIQNSTSWQITSPMRSLSVQLKKVSFAFALVPMLFRRGGGVTRTTVKVLDILKREGVSGITTRLTRMRRGLDFSPESNELVDRNDYGEWVRRYDSLTDEDRSGMQAEIAQFNRMPLISVIMPTYKSRPEWLIEAIESVRKQTYQHFELCIADDASDMQDIRNILEDYLKADPRIKVVFRTVNGHISEASNSALELATGEWIALLDHDDLLAENALFHVASAINRHPEAALIYSDEDKINEKGERFSPYFKCDWNRALFYSHNMITHLGVYRADLVRSIGGFLKGAEGAQDYDLALRYIERIEAGQIIHIPRILYHWREHQESTALSADAKPYAMLTGELVLNEHLERRGLKARAELIGHGFRVKYELPAEPPLVSLIIPTRNGLSFVRQCVESIVSKTTYPTYEIIIIDNNSDDPATLEYFREFEPGNRVRVIRDERPFNFSGLNNAGVKAARGEIVGLLNNDLEVISPDWLSEMVSFAIQPEVGAVGAKLLYPNDTIQHGGVILGIGGWAGHAHKGFPRASFGYAARASLIQEFSAVTGACLVMRKEAYHSVGGLNEIDLQIACNDVDLCLKLRKAGLRNIWTPYAELYHHESATRGYEDTPEKQSRFKAEVAYMKANWGTLLQNDPAYSPNLTLDSEDFSLAWPPALK